MSYDQDRSKKRKISEDDEYVESSRSRTIFNPSVGREWTVSVAIPGSILLQCRRDEQRTAVVNQIARALAVYSIDEVVIYDDSPMDKRVKNVDPTCYMGDIDPCGYLEHLLNYVEVPPFMRKALVPMHANLKQAALLDSLDMPHHPHPSDWLPYREGVTTSGAGKGGKGTIVDVGGKQKVTIDADIPHNTRVTLKLNEEDESRGEAVHPQAPKTEAGYYWGYSIRRCGSLAGIFEECAYEGGYDVSVGTSERGIPIAEEFALQMKKREPMTFNHLLVVFGGPQGIEHAAEFDPALQEMGIIRMKTKHLFDHWVNVLPSQGSRNIRTSEALWAGLAALRPLWDSRY